MNWSLTADLGGTKSLFGVYVDDERQPRTTLTLGPGSLTLGVEGSISRVHDAINEFASDYGPPHRLTIGAAGTQNQARSTAFLQGLSQYDSIDLVTDGFAHLIGAFGGQPGICVAVVLAR